MNDPNLGQILPNSLFGKMLTMLALKSQVIVETGTWRGEGSTRCIAMGLVRPEQRFVTVEAHEPMWREAKARYNDSRITFLCGTVSPMNDAPVVLDQIPAEIDLLLIDGGEDNGTADFEALWGRCKVIALDDTADHCRKGKEARRRLLEAGWKVLADYPADRNGWCVFERPKVEAPARLENSVEVVVKAFERPHLLGRLLDSIHASYPELTVWVTDDSREHFKATRPTERVLKLPFDVGKLCARQVALSHVTTPYALMLDDDFVMEERTDLRKLLQVAQETRALFTGGDVLDKGAEHGRQMMGELVYVPGDHLTPRAIEWDKAAAWVQTDFLADFYLADVKQLRELGGYDCRLKIGGSMEVFLRAKLAGMKLVFVPSVVIGHWAEYGPEYRQFRDRCSEELSQFWKPIAEGEYGLKHYLP